MIGSGQVKGKEASVDLPGHKEGASVFGHCPENPFLYILSKTKFRRRYIFY